MVPGAELKSAWSMYDSTHVCDLETRHITSTHMSSAYARLIAMPNIKTAGEFNLPRAR